MKPGMLARPSRPPLDYGETTFVLTLGQLLDREVLQTGWINSDPSGVTLCETTDTIVPASPPPP